MVIDEVLDGCCFAEGGFKKTFLNNKIVLGQAESVSDLINSKKSAFWQLMPPFRRFSEQFKNPNRWVVKKGLKGAKLVFP
ncbi:MAG: hypothetical protein CM15mP88_2490 [Pseudomonadota bacterium]|nr:MAG: hypothetical protein CM15mP88_2490 [Pseudomonadota bacterium]